MGLNSRITILAQLGQFILAEPDELKGAITKSCYENPWFQYEEYYSGLEKIANYFLDEKKLHAWVSKYNFSSQSPKKIGLVLAGNIPMVGFHDVLCVFISGHAAQIKLSDRDKYVLPLLINEMAKMDSTVKKNIVLVDRLSDYDAIIATGSDNTKLHFEYYFKDYPKVLRGNRNGVAVLTGEESDLALSGLADDIFLYYGLGCRNVSKLYVPLQYDFKRLVDAMDVHKDRINHNKYRNNYDYNLAIYTLNQEKHINTGLILLKEDKSLHSRIATLHYEYYDSLPRLEENLKTTQDKMQCIASEVEFDTLDCVKFGNTQKPELTDYADGFDVMHWLQEL